MMRMMNRLLLTFPLMVTNSNMLLRKNIVGAFLTIIIYLIRA